MSTENKSKAAEFVNQQGRSTINPALSTMASDIESTTGL